MKYLKDFGYMSIIETATDVDNTFLSRRELTCDFTGLAGKLKKLEAIDMVTKEFNLDNKVVIPIRLKSHAGKSTVTGTFFSLLTLANIVSSLSDSSYNHDPLLGIIVATKSSLDVIADVGFVLKYTPGDRTN